MYSAIITGTVQNDFAKIENTCMICRMDFNGTIIKLGRNGYQIGLKHRLGGTVN